MPDNKTAKLTQFANDEMLNSAVRSVFDEIYLKKSEDRDVQNLAARFLANELLEKVWNVLMGYKSDKDVNSKDKGNIGI